MQQLLHWHPLYVHASPLSMSPKRLVLLFGTCTLWLTIRWQSFWRSISFHGARARLFAWHCKVSCQCQSLIRMMVSVTRIGCFFRSTALSRPNKSGLNVRSSTKSFSDFWWLGVQTEVDEWYTTVCHMTRCDGSQKFAIMADYKVYHLHRYAYMHIGGGDRLYSQKDNIEILIGQILIFVRILCHLSRDLQT